ncbi:MAG: hypothetical protein ACRC8K_23940 [Waterburya sp.]
MIFSFASCLLEAVALDGNYASSYNGGNLRNGLASQDRAASLLPTPTCEFNFVPVLNCLDAIHLW